MPSEHGYSTRSTSSAKNASFKNAKEPEVQHLIKRRRLIKKIKTPTSDDDHEATAMLIESDTDGSLGTGTEKETSDTKYVEKSGTDDTGADLDENQQKVKRGRKKPAEFPAKSNVLKIGEGNEKESHKLDNRAKKTRAKLSKVDKGKGALVEMSKSKGKRKAISNSPPQSPNAKLLKVNFKLLS
jgi:hypothetical protein